MSQTIDSIVAGVRQMVGQKTPEHLFERLGQDQLIQLADQIRDICKNSDMLDPPVLCVVGSQSSGKSITLNGLTGLDILPNGRQIVTRTPVCIRLIRAKDAKHIRVDFHDDRNDALLQGFQLDLTPTIEQLMPVRSMISSLTEQYAGRTKNVVDTPIQIRISSPHVPHLSVIDLPGLTSIALTDEGQPADIKTNIEAMISKYISNPRTLILAIVPATIDLESDMGLGLIKTHDPEFARTIGVITKVDMLRDSDVTRYLEGNMSKNLHLAYGYYAVRNRSSEEIKYMSVKDGHVAEQRFFDQTDPYKGSEARDRMGSANLGSRLSEILIAHLRKCLPEIVDQIREIEQLNTTQLNEIGYDYPQTDQAKRTTANSLLCTFYQEYQSAVLDRGSTHRIGARIADSFARFKQAVEQIKPFDNLDDQMIGSIVGDYNGLHMPDSTLSTGVIEKCFSGALTVERMASPGEGADQIVTIDPLQSIRDPYRICLSEIQGLLGGLVDTIVVKERFARFPRLCARIREIVCGQIIVTRYTQTNEKVDDFFVEETGCVWSDDVHFRANVLPMMFDNKPTPSRVREARIRDVLMGYFVIVRGIAIHSIRKKITAFLVNKVIDDVGLIGTDASIWAEIGALLEEPKDKAMRREKLLTTKQRIEAVKKAIKAI